MSWEIVMGLEVHAELLTKTKIFCGCRASFGGEPNTHVCPVCSGMPGALPKLNRAVVDCALRLGLALGCDITRHCKFDRKNYFYPDLPKAYQVSQLYAPICRNGKLGDIRLYQIHMEEDAGKLLHTAHGTRMDFNRCGVPLLEIVTQPDFRSTEQVLAYLEQLRETLVYLDICDGKMQEGSLRCDVNLSVRRPGEDFGTRTETKNLNSFKAIGRAIAYEAQRQIALLESGQTVTQETRRWDDNKEQSYSMRSKENAQDYRYFPEPDLLPMHIDEAWLARVQASLPELAAAKRARLAQEFGLSEYGAKLLTEHKELAGLFEDIARQSGQPKEAANLIIGEIMRLMNSTNTLPEDVRLDAGKAALLIALVVDSSISRAAFKQTVGAMFTHGVDPQAYIDENGLRMVNDNSAVEQAVAKALAENPNAVADYNAGLEKAFGFLMGQVMRQLGRAGNPEVVRKVLVAQLTIAEKPA
ncbi:MAG: Asp-tRNA(Asn)/Glu-tRNA(Gln) amidotransferase subunit GatB [Oscillospiraceae bacterium]|nr:Asp-tRNA(Asn)/Glu-tRNA(Gln) amidotransferase subunit GatB [Oscillospiraceae bacterium]